MERAIQTDRQEVSRFGEFTLDVPDRRLTWGVCAIHLAPKTFDVLVALVRRAGRLVSKHELLAVVWPGIFVDEGILTVHVAALRKALGERKRFPRYIETVSGSGYRFIGVFQPSGAVDVSPQEPPVWLDREARL